jgi:apolipoprotein N-acyltransferase
MIPVSDISVISMSLDLFIEEFYSFGGVLFISFFIVILFVHCYLHLSENGSNFLFYMVVFWWVFFFWVLSLQYNSEESEQMKMTTSPIQKVIRSINVVFKKAIRNKKPTPKKDRI